MDIGQKVWVLLGDRGKMREIYSSRGVKYYVLGIYLIQDYSLEERFFKNDKNIDKSLKIRLYVKDKSFRLSFPSSNFLYKNISKYINFPKYVFFSKDERVSLPIFGCKIRLVQEDIKYINNRKYLGFLSKLKIRRKIDTLQDFFLKKFTFLLPEPHASLSAGILLGINRTMPQQFYDNLVTTGTLHIIAASGYNITIVATLTFQILQKIFHRKHALLFSFITIAFYTVVAGASPAVVRAALMGSLSFLALYSGRLYQARRALIISSLCMLAFSPLLVWNISFQLSVSATFGILWIMPILQHYIPCIQTRFIWLTTFLEEIHEAFITTTSASLMTIPIILVHFGRMSLVSFIANTFLLWLTPFIMGLSALFLLFSFFSTFLAKVISFGIWILCEFFIQGVTFFASFPYAQITFISVPLWFVVFWYVFIILLLSIYRKTFL